MPVESRAARPAKPPGSTHRISAPYSALPSVLKARRLQSKT